MARAIPVELQDCLGLPAAVSGSLQSARAHPSGAQDASARLGTVGHRFTSASTGGVGTPANTYVSGAAGRRVGSTASGRLGRPAYAPHRLPGKRLAEPRHTVACPDLTQRKANRRRRCDTGRPARTGRVSARSGFAGATRTVFRHDAHRAFRGREGITRATLSTGNDEERHSTRPRAERHRHRPCRRLSASVEERHRTSPPGRRGRRILERLSPSPRAPRPGGW